MDFFHLGFGNFKRIGAANTRPFEMNVQHDLDWPRFIEMYIERVQRPVGD